MWEPPFSLDLTNVSPDIIYCVDVYNITCGSFDLLVSDCDVAEPFYMYSDHDQEDILHHYVVTPRSNAENTNNGTPTVVNGRYSALYFLY